MSFINFGYIADASRSINSFMNDKSVNTPLLDMAMNDYNTGDIVRSQFVQLNIIGGSFDFIWGIYSWGDTKHKVSK